MKFFILPTLILFVDGMPVAKRSGTASASQIDMFLKEYLPLSENRDECIKEVTLDGEMFDCKE